MSLASQIAALASRVATEIKALVRPDHPGLARAWVSFGYNGSAMVIYAAHNVAGVTRLAAGATASPLPPRSPMPTTAGRRLPAVRPTPARRARALARSTSDAKTAAYVEVVCATGNTSLADTTEMNLVVYR